jgi:DNA (cytosine-5)-methyltransferase 1
MLRAVQEIKPKFVIAENVFGITNIDGGMVFEQVCLDLETEGYEVQPFIIPAAAKNAPHRRDRCWFVGVRNAADTNSRGLERAEKGGRNGINVERKSEFGNATNADSNGFQQRNGNDEINTSKGGKYALGDIDESIVNGNATDTNGIRLERRLHSNGREREISACNVTTFNTPFSRTTWEKFPTQSPICGGDDGLPTELDGITFSKWRAESIKGYGNAIVPQVALELFQVIEKINCNLSK